MELENFKAYMSARGIQVNGPNDWDLQVHDDSWIREIELKGTLAIGDAYVSGLWDCKALDELVCRLFSNMKREMLFPSLQMLTVNLWNRLSNPQAGTRAKKVIDAHYEKYIDVIKYFIGPSLCYSCAWWEHSDNLADAQKAKMDLVCRKLQLAKSDRVLDIGCGYGALANHAAEYYGCHVTGITLSPRQAELATARFPSPLIEFRAMDWQSDEFMQLGEFDKIMSVGMFEHVGRKNYTIFFKRCSHLLRSHGLFLLHTIGRSVKASIDLWVDRYIFPGGSLPKLGDLDEVEAQNLILEDLQNIGAHYDMTLCAWQANLDHGQATGELDLDEKDLRFWRYYLLSFAGAFRVRKRLQVWQLLLAKSGVIGGYNRPEA